jgi:hypothetical protein
MKIDEFQAILTRIHNIAYNTAKCVNEKALLPELDFDPEEYKDGVFVRFEIPLCGCCPGEYEGFTIKYEWLETLTDEQITSRILDTRATEKLAQEQLEEELRQARMRKREEQEKEQYLKLKEKYEGD